MSVEAKAIILLDDISRNVIKTSISSIGAEGFRFISALDEINEEILQDSKILIVLEGFALQENSILDLELYSKLYELKVYFLGAKKYFQVYETIAVCFECDISLLTNKIIQAAMFEDRSLEDSHVVDRFDVYDDAQKILSEKESHDSSATKVAAAFIALMDRTQFFEERNKRLESKNKLLITENDKILNERKILLGGYQQVILEAKRLNSSLEKYERIFSRDIYEKVKVYEYPNKPMIVYLKEYEDFINLDEMLETLYNVFRIQTRQSVKILRLFDSCTSRKMDLLPDYYKKVRNTYVISEVITADFIAKPGDYHKIFEKLLLNEVGLDILVVVDSKSFDDIVVAGTPLQFNLCREQKHSSAFGLHESNTILNDSNAPPDLYWTHYETDNMGKNEKFLFLSSQPVIQNILSLSQAFNQAV